MARDFSSFEIEVGPSSALTGGDWDDVRSLFDANYREANHAYLEKSFTRLAHVAIARREGVAAGFALGEMRLLDLPQLPRQALAMAGICCIAPAYRRMGLFVELEVRAIAAAGVVPQGRILSAGRTAHPASMRLVLRSTGAVPRPGMTPTAWQQEVGQAVADAYGVENFDPTTFVCRGSGVPIGYPVIEMGDVTPQEWEVFAPVDRSRGDSLLAIGWRPDAPAGWDA